MKVSRPHAKVSHSYAQPSQPTTSHLQPGSPASTSPGVVLTSPGLFFTTPRLVRTTPRLVRTRCQVDKETQQTESHAPLASPLLVGYLRTFLVEPSLMWMIFMPRLMPLLLFPSVLQMASMEASLSVPQFSIASDVMGRIVPNLFQSDVVWQEFNEAAWTQSTASLIKESQKKSPFNAVGISHITVAREEHPQKL